MAKVETTASTTTAVERGFFGRCSECGRRLPGAERPARVRKGFRDDEEDFVDADAVAGFLGVERRTIARWVNGPDRFPCYWLGPKLMRFRISEVARWMRHRKRVRKAE